LPINERILAITHGCGYTQCRLLFWVQISIGRAEIAIYLFCQCVPMLLMSDASVVLSFLDVIAVC